MTRKMLATWGVILVLLVSAFGSAAAQSGTEVTPTDTPTTVPSKFSFHPVVQILSAYFGRERVTQPPVVDVTETPVVEETPDPETTPDPNLTPDPNVTPDPDATPDADVTPEPSATPDPEVDEVTPESIAEEIAAYHEAGMGFGVLVKLYAMAEASEEACAAQPAPVIPADGAATEGDPAQDGCTPVTVEELVTSFQGGTGMGALFKEYGKPALLGVGHVRHELKKLDAQDEDGEVVEEGATIQDTQARPQKGGKPEKVKTPNPHRKNK